VLAASAAARGGGAQRRNRDGKTTLCRSVLSTLIADALRVRPDPFVTREDLRKIR
jgi:hypothetical protein